MKKILSSVLVCLFFANPSFADDIKDVEKFVNDFGNKIIDTAGNSKLSVNQRRDRLVAIIEPVVDTDWIAKFVLGRHYRTATGEQKDQFKKLYREFMINTYSPKFNGYSGEKFSITSVTSDGNYYTAKCLFFPKNDAPTVNVDFRVRKNTEKAEPKFLVFDIVAEGVSLIETQRSEFGSVITKSGLDGFMKDLQERIKALKSGKPVSNSSQKKA
ncbi:MAG: toluene tolerance protein [Rickettsiaceae bacterium]|jgi:phospholipid transport system substrate-binding protein|nr:toluene tolerance protein [Rickettsiaceae bacterium]